MHLIFTFSESQKLSRSNKIFNWLETMDIISNLRLETMDIISSLRIVNFETNDPFYRL